MDPFSAIGLIASLSDLIRASKAVIDVIKSFKDGEKELGALYSSVSLFEENLRGFDRVLRSGNTVHSISIETVDSAIKESATLMKELSDRLLSIYRSESSTMRRMKWVQHRSALEKIAEDLRGKCAMLHSLVSVAQMEMMLSMCGHNPQLLEMCTSVADEFSRDSPSADKISYTWDGFPSSSSTPTLDIPLTSPIQILNERKASNATEGTLGTSSRGSVSSTRSYLSPGEWSPRGSLSSQVGSGASVRRLSDSTSSSALSSLRSSSSSAAHSVFDAHSTASSASSVSLGLENTIARSQSHAGRDTEDTRVDSLVIRRACRFDCFCKCHSQTVAVADHVIQKFNGPIFGPETVLEKQIECSEPDCAGTIASQKRVIPSGAFFKRAMSRLSSTHSININVPLNTYRMVPEGSNSMRYAKQGNLEKLQLSMRLGESTLWDTAPDGWSLLHTAVYARQLPIVKYLCEQGADTRTSDLGSRRPVDLAILKSLATQATIVEKQIVQVLSGQDDFLIDFEFTPIHIAVLDLYDPADAERPSLEQLIDFVDDANNAKAGEDWSRWKTKYKRRSPLFLAIIEQFRVSAVENPNTRKVIHNLLDQKDRKFHWTPLHWACSTGRADKMKILVNAGADPFITSNLNANIIHAAVESNAVESLAFSLNIARNHPKRLNINHPNIWGESPLIMAAQGCLVDCIRLLLEAGADKNVRQENQQVALHYAGLSKRGAERQRTVALLCADSDGDDGSSDHINAQDEDGRPPIFDFLDDPKCTELLIQHGARLDLHDKSGKNIFHQTCIQGDSEQLKLLLSLSAASELDPTEKDHDGNTPLIEALRHGSISCAQILLARSDVGDIVGQDGWSAVHHAVRIGDPELLQMVLKHPSFEKGAKTGDGKTVQVIAMESGNWCGRVKELVRKYNSIA